MSTHLFREGLIEINNFSWMILYFRSWGFIYTPCFHTSNFFYLGSTTCQWWSCHGHCPTTNLNIWSFSHYNFNNTNWKKHTLCAWDSNLGPQDGRRRRNHESMAAVLFAFFVFSLLVSHALSSTSNESTSLGGATSAMSSLVTFHSSFKTRCPNL